MKSRSIALIGFCLLLTVVPAARAGTVTGVTVSQRTIVAGGTVSVTVTGTKPCGAAHIIYGDGDAITYAITGLPVTQTHLYQRSGTCPYDIYYGDGRAQEVDGPLPQETRHVYAQAGRYAVVVKPHPPCTGKFTEVVQVGDGHRQRRGSRAWPPR